jgi:hypothetical protein
LKIGHSGRNPVKGMLVLADFGILELGNFGIYIL